MNTAQIIFLILIILIIGVGTTLLIVYKDKIWGSDNKYYDPNWKSSPSSPNSQSRKRCQDNVCDYGAGWSEKWKKTTPHGSPPYCSGTTCTPVECCERRQKCSSYSCPVNYIAKNADNYCASIKGCTQEECCDPSTYSVVWKTPGTYTFSTPPWADKLVIIVVGAGGSGHNRSGAGGSGGSSAWAHFPITKGSSDWNNLNILVGSSTSGAFALGEHVTQSGHSRVSTGSIVNLINRHENLLDMIGEGGWGGVGIVGLAPNGNTETPIEGTIFQQLSGVSYEGGTTRSVSAGRYNTDPNFVLNKWGTGGGGGPGIGQDSRGGFGLSNTGSINSSISGSGNGGGAGGTTAALGHVFPNGCGARGGTNFLGTEYTGGGGGGGSCIDKTHTAEVGLNGIYYKGGGGGWPGGGAGGCRVSPDIRNNDKTYCSKGGNGAVRIIAYDSSKHSYPNIQHAIDNVLNSELY